MSVAVIIPTLNRPELLTRILDHLGCHHARYTQGIVIDQGERSVDSVWENCHFIDMNYWPGASLARNIGIQFALSLRDAPFICFWDDDDIPHVDYICTMRDALIANPDAALSACLVEHEGKVRPRESMNTASRMVRASVIGDRRWDGNGSGTDRRFWGQFDHLKTAYVDRVLYRTGNAKTGGLRDPTGEY